MNLSEEDVFTIANDESKINAINLIKKKLVHSNKTESEAFRNEILFDSILEIIYFCLKKGFTLSESVKCCLIQYELINKLKPSSNLSSSLDLFTNYLISINKSMNENKQKNFIDYMNLSFFTHFNLYKYVFTNERENKTINEERQVCCPSTEQSNYDTGEIKPYNIWEYENKILKLDEKEKNLIRKFELEREELIKEEMDARNLINFIRSEAYDADKSLDEELIQTLIDEISEPIINIATKSINSTINEFKEREKLKEEKKNLIKPVFNDFNDIQRKSANGRKSNFGKAGKTIKK